MDSKSVSY